MTAVTTGSAPLRLRGCTTLITGGGRGLGRCFAEALADAGANVVLTGRDPRTLGEAETRLRARGASVVAVQADLTRAHAMRRAVAEATAAFGAIDVLVNNAGVAGPHGPAWEGDAIEWWHALEVNLHGTVRACRAVLPSMIERRRGRVLNIVSAAGRHRWPHASAYSVSKAAVIKLTENLAAELRPHGVSAFSFDPGLVDLGMTRDHLEQGRIDDRWSDQILEWVRDQRRAGRFTPPERAASALVRLASGSADPLSGRYLTSDDDIDSLLRESQLREQKGGRGR
ncbi:NADP-dependent 3-hydroxy acid dehydrogenase YdfG [Nonomuraea solani]|uniref:NADP-dependent 3-hydroxy acid dehydrogenase YdfG n=1 Tax=Nonomuraea solani TaxID=1144553 RepID=A0A1H6DW36_9ACTN|nr:SDR family oxidoreductase [Nonomuraea solani]SEG89409.1 NADP-dependent 3-hydroxy acid dehydrogenase YdfG [Nonomuraea solani]